MINAPIFMVLTRIIHPVYGMNNPGYHILFNMFMYNHLCCVSRSDHFFLSERLSFYAYSQ